ncbi:MAG: bifunctional riboflavin kinase/FAD synthetase [Burkholderiales bacterium]|nr:bifunctional riboflavin kinase/FAD synthetase [Burkholderiales bacterium]
MRITRSIPLAADTPIALTIGNFDGVHLGHQAMLARLREAAARHGIPACVMTFEPHPREFFAPDQAPTRLTSLREKLELIAAQGVERMVVCRFNYEFAQIAAQDFIERTLVKALGVRWLLVGDDFRFGARRAGDFVMLKQAASRFGYEVEAMASVTLDGERVSSTAVRNALAAGDLAYAGRLLGRPYSISGRVVRGDGLGRKLGFPTANMQMKHNRPPLTGIFVVELSGVAERPLRGVASLGIRPTVKPGGQPVLEVHVFDFDGDLYGKHVRVDFLHKLRDEEKYADLATLTRRIALDVENAKAFFSRQDSSQYPLEGCAKEKLNGTAHPSSLPLAPEGEGKQLPPLSLWERGRG